MQYESITTETQLASFCDSISAAPYVAFDTEFVSEDTFRPQLCLIQVAAAGRVAVIDPLAVPNVDCFWNVLADPKILSIVHAGREELRFSLRAIGRGPGRLFDTQIAAGLIGLEYPAAYNTLITRLLGKSLPKGETRTDWRIRPLSRRQLEYAAQDVAYLQELQEVLQSRLTALDRLTWLDTEMATWQAHVEAADSDERWRRVSGISILAPRALAIVRELWRWREEEARQRDQPAKRVLRDDLIVELARRQTADPKRIRAVRGMSYRGIQRHVPALAECVQRALNLPDESCPTNSFQRSTRSQLNLLAQFLATALGSICREAQVAASIVGTSQDVRDLIAYHLEIDGFSRDNPPELARGWRAQVVGKVIDDLLDGQLCIRITDPLSDQPLGIESRATQ